MESTNVKSQNDYNRIIITLLSIICVVILGMVLKNASSIFIPFVLAIFLSFILNPVITFLEKLRFPGVLAILLSVILSITVLGLIGIFIKGSIESFVTEFPKYENRINDIVENLLQLFGASSSTGESALEDNPQLADLLENFSVSSLIKGMVASMGSFLSSSFLIFLILMFLLAGRKQ
ncbi:MAG: AI-2E family transporter, partial [Ignavibacteria bacterium]|nr:AI-2E family transporter [Ignavibacteria bacterium]